MPKHHVINKPRDYLRYKIPWFQGWSVMEWLRNSVLGLKTPFVQSFTRLSITRDWTVLLSGSVLCCTCARDSFPITACVHVRSLSCGKCKLWSGIKVAVASHPLINRPSDATKRFLAKDAPSRLCRNFWYRAVSGQLTCRWRQCYKVHFTYRTTRIAMYLTQCTLPFWVRKTPVPVFTIQHGF